MHPTPADALAGIAAGVILTLLAVCGLIWRLSAWHTALELRLKGIERRVAHLERIAGVPERRSHKARRSEPL